ncbi:MAG: hypothetical protein A2583_16790 [Bdellovibrionales bacterium RIFOXYD1_FULL_53_11]|nr:MAG: hypothetical protein A2583_16790 [Bdellovibrionales bacterium RIFOXYD1_FULL_53_11]
MANVGEAFGFGSRAGAFAGASTAWGFDAFSAYSNPGALAMTGEKRLLFSWAVMDMEARMKPISGVIIENDYTSGQYRRGDVDTSYRSTFGQSIGVVYKIAPDWFGITFGLVGFMPVNHIAYVDTGEPFIPEYLFYRSRTQRPQIEMGLGAEPFRGLYAGAGIHIAYSLTTSATIMLQSSPSKTSSMRFAATLKPKVAPQFGLLYAPGEGLSKPFTIGAVFRFPVASANNLTMKSGARVLGDLTTLDFNCTAMSAIFYDPMTVEIGATVEYLRGLRAIIQADYQFWNKFEPPALEIREPAIEQTGIRISGSKNPPFEMRNILIPRIAHEWEINDFIVWRAGYAYRPGVFKSVPTNAGNYLDPSKHMLSAGVGLRFRSFLGFQTPASLDLHGAYHHMVSQKIAKSGGDERGLGSGELKIGAPGYETGGKQFGGGASLTLAF